MKTKKEIIYLYVIIILFAVKGIYPQMEKSGINIKSDFFQNFLNEVNAAEGKEKQKLTEEFIVNLSSAGYPIYENDSTVILLYKGDRDTVEVIGDMTDWAYTVPMKRIEDTDLFYFRGVYEPDARLEYWLQFSKEEFPSKDPLNKYKSLNGFGDISELAMPAYERHPIFNDYITGKKGDYKRVREFVLPAGELDYEHTIHVYLPPDYSRDRSYPVVYFQDGRDYIEYAVVPHILDELIKDNKIKPVIAVFVTPPNLHQPKLPNRMTEYGMNDDYAEFFSEELVDHIDKNYSTIKNAEGRLVVGDSYGGLISTYIAFKNPEIFKNAYSQSGFHSFTKDKMINLIKDSETKPINLYIDIGLYERKVGAAFIPADETDFLAGNRRLKTALEEKNYKMIYKEYPEGHTWGNWRRHLMDALIYFFGI